jgi:hypothetical protein
MAKLLVERPRYGRGLKFPRGAEGCWRRVPTDERARRESLKMTWARQSGQLKSLNENLAPLLRFLRSRIGRRWDDVYSEICERINRDSAVQLHIWQHLMWSVERDPVRLAKVMARSPYGPRCDFYVDPVDGHLREWLDGTATKRYWRERRVAERQPRFHTIGGRHYKRLDGIWYELTLAAPAGSGQPVWDACLRRLVGPDNRPGHTRWNVLQAEYGTAVYAAAKRQLGKRELRRLRPKLEAPPT